MINNGLFYVLAFLPWVYAFLLWFLARHYLRLPRTTLPAAFDALPKATLIIPVRNEANNLPALLTDLTKQRLPQSHFQVIVMDDNSTDDTKAKAEAFLDLLPLKVLSLAPKAGHTYKKRAITEALQHAHNPIIISTDGDCRMGPDWLLSMVAPFQDERVNMVCGPVSIPTSGSVLQQWQSYDFAGLVSTGAASLQLGWPNMCNGANLAYRYAAFQRVGGYRGIDKLASGDDEFLMHRIWQQWPKSVRFLRSSAALVSTHPQPDWGSLLRQRRRWAGKWNHYADWKVSVLGMGSGLAHLSVLLAAPFAMLGWLTWSQAIWVVLGKTAAEHTIVYLAHRDLGLKYKPLMLVSASFFHSFACVFFSLLGWLRPTYEWKGRRVR